MSNEGETHEEHRNFYRTGVRALRNGKNITQEKRPAIQGIRHQRPSCNEGIPNAATTGSCNSPNFAAGKHLGNDEDLRLILS